MTINQTRTIVGAGILMLTLVSGLAEAKCGGQGGHAHGGQGAQSSSGRNGNFATPRPTLTEARSAYIDDSIVPGDDESDDAAANVTRGARDHLWLRDHHRAGR